jgi:capsular exopolysaccharide synthesis family protein
MNMIEKYHSQQLVQRIVPLEASDTEANSSPNLIVPILRRWYIVLITFLVICAIGIPAVWLLIKPAYAVTAAIRVAPIISSILFSDKDSEGVVPMYQNFMNTQADLIKSDQVLQRVADDLVGKKLKFFESDTNPVAKLRNALIDGDITVVPGQKSELIMITMESQDTTEAVKIVDAFVEAYMAIEVSRETKGGDQKLSILESEHKVLADKLQMQRQTIRQMAEEYGSVVLTGRQEMMLKRVADLQAELTKSQTRRITLETQQHAKIELAQLVNYEKRLRDMLAKENGETIELGRKQLAIQDQQEQLELTKELYSTVGRRIQELEMERKRPARISIAYNASVAPVPNKRIKYTAALIFGSLAAGCFLALLISKADYSLYTPGDVTKRVGIRIIGTTANTDFLDTPQLPEQISYDYQTIRANLGLLNVDGIPNKLVITSAGMRDGKTTFSINFATSLAKANKKVLLIDGDLRKPDIQRLLNIPKGSRGLQDVLGGRNFEDVVHSSSAGFDVLAVDSQNMSDAFELISLPHVSEFLNTAGTKYDHVIIDTPPVLAFPDALAWAKMADGVILTSFSGRTTGHDLRETLERLEQIKVKVLGTVFHNVSSNYSYNRYAYGYYTNQTAAGSNHRKNKKTAILDANKKIP